jgi:hypothetical protein
MVHFIHFGKLDCRQLGNSSAANDEKGTNWRGMVGLVGLPVEGCGQKGESAWRPRGMEIPYGIFFRNGIVPA